MASQTEQSEIWILDDDADLLRSIEIILGTQGLPTRTFISPLDLLDAAQHETPSLVIADLMMPELSGLSLIQHLRALDTFQTIPILVLTAMTGDDVLADAFGAGADDFIHKPFVLDEFLARVRSRLRIQKVVHELSQRSRDARFLFEMSTTLNSTLDLRGVLKQLVQKAALALEVDRCSIILLGRFQSFNLDASDAAISERSFRLVAASDNLEINDVFLSIDDYPEIEQVIRTREPVIVEDVWRSPLMASVMPELKELGVRSIVLFPMMVFDELVGVLFIRSRLELWHLSDRRRALGLTAANVAANAIRNAQMYEEIVAERLRLDDALRELEKTRDFLTNLIDASVDAIVASSIDGDVIIFNKAAETILGYQSAEVVDKMKVWELYPDNGAREIMRMLRSDAFGGVGSLDSLRTELLDHKGEQVPVSISSAIIYENGEERATMGIFTDLRDRLRMEKALARANEHIEQSRSQRVAVELAGATAHELNQPLTSVLGYVELLSLRLAKDDKNQETIGIVLEQVTRMADIVKKLGKITRYKTKTYLGETQIVDIDMASVSVDE